jgi:hypothetical protein
MNSPMLPPVMSPKLSEAMTLLKLSAARCSMIAFAFPSRSEETTNSPSFTTPAPGVVLAAPLVRSAIFNSKSRVATAPACTLTRALAFS